MCINAGLKIAMWSFPLCRTLLFLVRPRAFAGAIERVAGGMKKA